MCYIWGLGDENCSIQNNSFNIKIRSQTRHSKYCWAIELEKILRNKSKRTVNKGPIHSSSSIYIYNLTLNVAQID